MSVTPGFLAARHEAEELVVRLQYKLRLCRETRSSRLIVPASIPAPSLDHPPQPHFQAVGYPPCTGGEVGYWQPYVYPDRQHIAVILTHVDFLDPSTAICWVPGNLKLKVQPLSHE